MRQSHQKSRSRNRGRKTQNPLSRNFESNGPDVKIRGNASHIAEKYSSLARDAQSNGDTVMAENYLQHAEHYNRIVASAQVQNANKAEEANSLNGKGARSDEGEPAAAQPENSDKSDRSSARSDMKDDAGDNEKPVQKRKTRQSVEKASKDEASGVAEKTETGGDTKDGENISEDAASLPQSITGEIAAENS